MKFLKSILITWAVEIIGIVIFDIFAGGNPLLALTAPLTGAGWLMFLFLYVATYGGGLYAPTGIDAEIARCKKQLAQARHDALPTSTAYFKEAHATRAKELEAELNALYIKKAMEER